MDQAADRTNRLAALREARDKKKALEAAAAGEEAPPAQQSQTSGTSGGAAAENGEPKVIFRNYNPQADNLADAKLPNLQASEPEKKSNASDLYDPSAPLNVMPATANADLKREVAGKLEILDKRTQRAIVEIMREQAAGDGAELAAVVATR